jgi:hypothetical protein
MEGGRRSSCYGPDNNSDAKEDAHYNPLGHGGSDADVVTSGPEAEDEHGQEPWQTVQHIYKQCKPICIQYIYSAASTLNEIFFLSRGMAHATPTESSAPVQDPLPPSAFWCSNDVAEAEAASAAVIASGSRDGVSHELLR